MTTASAGETRAEQTAVTIVRPAAPGRLIFTSPHSGVLYPDDLNADPTLSEASLRSAEDALVDRLIAPGPAHGATLVLARLGRAYVDLNRDPADLDPQLIEGLEHPASPRSAAGYGVLPRQPGTAALSTRGAWPWTKPGRGWRRSTPPGTQPWPPRCTRPATASARRC